MQLSKFLFVIAACTCCSAIPFQACATGNHAEPQNYAFSLYAGRLTDLPWYRSFNPGVSFVNSDVLVGALSRTIYRSPHSNYSYEIEGQIGKHFGIQDHWEYNLLAAVRRHRLPWFESLNSSAAFGLGLSHAEEVPRFETIDKGSSEKLLAYWHLELTLGPARSNWQALMRLHHRSTAFGQFGQHGGSNALTLGARYEFD